MCFWLVIRIKDSINQSENNTFFNKTNDENSDVFTTWEFYLAEIFSSSLLNSSIVLSYIYLNSVEVDILAWQENY